MKICQRSEEKEILDLGSASYTKEEYTECLVLLNRIGQTLGGNYASYRAFDKLQKAPQSVLDIGCGGGGFTICLAGRYPTTKVVGIDISKDAIAFSNDLVNKQYSHIKNVEFRIQNEFKLNLPANSFDVVTSTLVCHHMNDDELIDFLKDAYQIANQAVILNDLHRHALAYAGFSVIAPIFFRNRLIIQDGLLSIKRAFKRKDWKALLSAAGIDEKNCQIKWHWPFRWTITIDSSK